MLFYVTNMSVDGYIEDRSGAFDWVDPDEVHPFFVELLQPVGTYLYGRRMYETMAVWDAPVESFPPEYRPFARLWQQSEKIAFSRTLTSAETRKTRLERDFDVDAIRTLKQESAHDITIGGAELASVALETNLVDECHLLVHPVICGGGKPAFQTNVPRNLELIETRRIGTGATYMRYRVMPQQ